MKTMTILIALILVLPALAYSQERGSVEQQPGFIDNLSRRPFYVDYAAFKDSLSDSLIVEIYFKVFSSSLSYQKWGQKFKAAYTVDITINKKKKQITGISRDGELIADTYRATLSADDFIIDKAGFKLPGDDYEMSARLTDRHSDDQLRVKRNLRLKDSMSKTPSLSLLEFVRQESTIEKESKFDRADMELIPSASRVYGEEDPDLIFYYEIYNTPAFRGDYLATYTIHADDKIVAADTSLFPGAGAVTSRLEKIMVDNLIPGEYKLNMEIKSPGNNLSLKMEENFVIGWSVVALVKNDYKTAIEQLRYVATEDQIKRLLKTPKEEQVKAWTDYWKSKDPTPSTLENELKDEYYKRVRYADLNFGNMGKDGWKTDMGRVYIVYGPPDEIERHPFELDSKPYQIWYYYTLKLIFRFVEINGYGDYELLYPYDGDITKYR